MSEKNYINGIYVREKKFDNGGSILNVGIKLRDFVKQLEAIVDDKGYANIVISERREPSEGGITHTVYQNTWQPKSRYANQEAPQQQDTDGIPF